MGIKVGFVLSLVLIVLFFGYCKKVENTIYNFKISVKKVNLKIGGDIAYRDQTIYKLKNTISRTTSFPNASTLLNTFSLLSDQIVGVNIDSAYFEIPGYSSFDFRYLDSIRVFVKGATGPEFIEVLHRDAIKNVAAGSKKLSLDLKKGAPQLLFFSDFLELYIDGNSRLFLENEYDIDLNIAFVADARPYYK